MKYPFDVSVQGRRWVARKGDGDVFDEKLYGLCRSDKQELILARNLHPEREASTLVHELLHVLFDQAEMRESDHLAPHEEEIVSRFTNGLTDLIVKNPELMKHIRTVHNKVSKPTKGS